MSIELSFYRCSKVYMPCCAICNYGCESCHFCPKCTLKNCKLIIASIDIVIQQFKITFSIRNKYASRSTMTIENSEILQHIERLYKAAIDYSNRHCNIQLMYSFLDEACNLYNIRLKKIQLWTF